MRLTRHFLGLNCVVIALTAPLAAQQIVELPIPDQVLRIETPAAEVTVNMVWPDSLPPGIADALADAYAEAAEPGIEMLRDEIARDREQQGPGTTERTVRNLAWLVLGVLAVKKLHQIATREPDVINVFVENKEGDVIVTVPPAEPHEHAHHHKDHDDDDSPS